MADDVQGTGPAPDNAGAIQARLDEIARARMTRRAALSKIGLRAGAAFLAALSVDDLARMASKQLDQRGAGNKVADKLAKEFKHAGVAFADESSSISSDGCKDSDPCVKACSDTKLSNYELVCKDMTGDDYINCVKNLWINWCKCIKGVGGTACACAATMPDQCSSCTAAGC